MKIGFYFEASTKSGGAYQYALTMIDALKAIPEHEYVAFNISPDFPYHLVKLPNWKVVDLIPVAKQAAEVSVTATQNIKADRSLRRRFNLFVLESIRALRLYRLENFLTGINARRRAAKFGGYGIDLMVYHGPSELSFLTAIPGIVPIHDIEHRLHKGEFPELSERGQYAKREYLFKHIARSAYRVLVDSQVSKEDIVREYRVPPERVAIVPFVPPMYLNNNLADATKQAVRKKFNLPERFIYYPANLWPHKNHLGILKALTLLNGRGVNVNAVFTGSTQDLWGEYARMKTFIAEHGLAQQTQFLGFVNADEISALYAMAEALVMPVLMGPTFIPVYEAWFMHCPVIYSDIRGPREQAGDAALLCNPHEPSDIAEKIAELWGNQALRTELAAKGVKRLARWTHEDFRTSIKDAINGLKKDQ